MSLFSKPSKPETGWRSLGKHMEFFKDRRTHITITVCLLSFCLLYVFLTPHIGFKRHFSLPYQPCTLSKTCNVTTNKDALEAALSKASMGNKTVIIAIVDKAYVEGDKPMLDLFLDSFWIGEDTRKLVDHILLVAVDETSFEQCKFLRLVCYRLQMDDGVDSNGEKVYMSDSFIKMMWRRTLFLGEVLKLDYSFIFTDTDVMWLRNPFPMLSQNERIDLQISTDKFNGNEWSEANPINTGFYFIRSNNKTISLFDAWYAMKNNAVGLKEQDVFINMMHEGVFKELGLTVRFLDTNYFSGFCRDSKDFKAVRTVHANCCLTISAKLKDLMAVIHDWERFKRASTDGNISTA